MSNKQQSESTLRSVLKSAIEDRKDHVRIPPGTYRIGADPATVNKEKCHLLFRDVHDMEIDATGVTLIAQDALTHNGVYFLGCSGITLKGMTYENVKIFPSPRD